MGKVKLYDTSIPRSLIAAEREATYRSKSPEEKFHLLLSLIRLSIKLNNGQPLKQPQGKGLVISRKK